MIALPPSHVVNIYNHNHTMRTVVRWPILMAVAILTASTSSAPTSGCAPSASRRSAARHRRQQPAVHDKGRRKASTLQEQEEEEEEEEDLSEDSIAAATVSHSVKITKASSASAPKGAKKIKKAKKKRRPTAAQVGHSSQRGIQGHAAEAACVEEEGAEMSATERGALIGSALMSPAGMPGLIVGASIGGAAGYVADRVEQAMGHVASLYGERVRVERQNEEAMAAAASELQTLDKIRVVSDNATEAAELEAALYAFLNRPCNRKCADCAAKLKTRNEAWASLNGGVLVCKDCAAVHRGLGVSVSRIRSVVFDRWDPSMARVLLAAGNEQARGLYLARLPRGYAEPKPTSSDERRREFITAKYVRLRWAEPEVRQALLAKRRAEDEEPSEASGMSSGKSSVAKRKRKRSASSSSSSTATRPLRTGAMPSLSSDGP